RQRAVDCARGRQIRAAGGEHGRRRVHVCVSRARSAVRPGPFDLERRRTPQSPGVEAAGSDPRVERHGAGHHRHVMNLTLAFSPCPNDCFVFDAIVNRRIDLEGLEFSVRLADVEALNKAAFAGDVDVTKLSFHAYAYCADAYVLLDAGSALGNNCGPLLISKRPIGVDEVASGRLRIAIPGKYTTANFLLGLAFPDATDKSELVFSEIEPAVLSEQYDAGLIIHENRFTYQA